MSKMRADQVTIGFSSHHVETLPYIREQMECHPVTVLEEPSSPQFPAMLDGSLPVEEYLAELDSGFPEFDRVMCDLLREFHGKGRRFIQVEPYLESLLEIHELFAAGKSSGDLAPFPRLLQVYEAERLATGALIAYYATSVKSPFDQVVEAVKRFTRANVKRLKVRERMRAQAIGAILNGCRSVFIEAGYIHYPLYHYLRRELGPERKIRIVFLLDPVVRKLGAKRRNLGPGDLLTFLYTFHTDLSRSTADLLAARSVISAKLIQKEELLPGPSPAPHSEDQLRINHLVDRLTFQDCGKLFEQVRFARCDHALELVTGYLEQLPGKTEVGAQRSGTAR
jgi:hypothetical protein